MNINQLANWYLDMGETIKHLRQERKEALALLEEKLARRRKYRDENVSASRFSIARVTVSGYTRRSYKGVRVNRLKATK